MVISISFSDVLLTGSSCPGNSAPLNVSGETYNLTEDITTTGSCISIFGFPAAANNIVLNCNGFRISGDGGGTDKGIEIGLISASSNITINNCIIENFGSGLICSSSSRFYVNNITTINSTYGINTEDCAYSIINNSHIYNNNVGVFKIGQGNSIYNTIIENNTQGGIEGNGDVSSNNIIDNVTIRNNNIGIDFGSDSRGNMQILNSNIYNNTLYNIDFTPTSAYTFTNIFFQNNYLGNWSKIYTDNFANFNNVSFYDNTYLGATQLYDCFDYLSTNLSCENQSIIVLGSSSLGSVFPSFGISSFLFLLGGLILFFR
jgi:hypothetical protein